MRQTLQSLAGILLIAAVARTASALDIGDLIVSVQNVQGSTAPDGRIVAVNPVTGAQKLVSSGGYLVDPAFIATDPQGRIIVADLNSGTFGSIIRIDPSSGVQQLIARDPLLQYPAGVAVAADGTIFVSREESSDGSNPPAVLKINPESGAISVLTTSSVLNVPQGLKWGRDGSIYLAVGSMPMFRIDPVSGERNALYSRVPGFTHDVVQDLSADTWLVLSEDLPDIGYISRVNTTTGSAVRLATDNYLSHPACITCDLAGDVVVADQNSGVVGVDATTGRQWLISSGGLLVNPTGIAVATPEPSSLFGVAVAICVLRRRDRAR